MRQHKYFTQDPKSPSRVITVARARSRKALPTRTYAAFLRALSCRHVRSGSSSSRLAPGRNSHSVSPCDCCLQEPCIVWLFICLVGTSHTHCCVSQQTMFTLAAPLPLRRSGITRHGLLKHALLKHALSHQFRLEE